MHRSIPLLAAALFTLPACGLFRSDPPPDAAAPAPERTREVSIPTVGLTLKGTFHRFPRSPERGGLAVLLLHELGADRAGWDGLIADLEEKPLVVFAMDLRGHGASVRRPGEADTWRAFGDDPARWQAMVDDVAKALQFLDDHHNPDRIAIVGAGLGGSAALLALARRDARRQDARRPEDPRPDEPTPVVGVAVISPGLAYRGLDLRELRNTPLVLAAPRSVLLLGARQDPPVAEAIAELRNVGGDRVQVEDFPGSDHGIALMEHPRATDDRWSRIVRWLNELPAPARQR